MSRLSEEYHMMASVVRLCRRTGRGALLLGALLSLVTAAAGAQQGCLVATPDARLSVNVFLWAEEKPWRESLGITARRVEDLVPLANPVDAALCQRMDS